MLISIVVLQLFTFNSYLNLFHVESYETTNLSTILSLTVINSNFPGSKGLKVQGSSNKE